MSFTATGTTSSSLDEVGNSISITVLTVGFRPLPQTTRTGAPFEQQPDPRRFPPPPPPGNRHQMVTPAARSSRRTEKPRLRLEVGWIRRDHGRVPYPGMGNSVGTPHQKAPHRSIPARGGTLRGTSLLPDVSRRSPAASPSSPRPGAAGSACRGCSRCGRTGRRCGRTGRRPGPRIRPGVPGSS